MSDDEPFSYKPLGVFKKEDEESVNKKRKRMPKGGSHKGKKSRSVDDDVKEEVKEGIVEMFAGTKRRQSLMDETPIGGIFITPFNWFFFMALSLTKPALTRPDFNVMALALYYIY